MKKVKQKRKGWFCALKRFLSLFIKKPKFVFAEKTVLNNSIFLCNHVGALAPLALELYAPFKFRFWGTFEMNSGLRSVYKYLSTVYFYRKKHFGKFRSKITAFFSAPFLTLFYKGLNLISTYRDIRLKKTIKESEETINSGENLVIFPEDSSNGYFDKLTHFYSGFVLLGKTCLKNGIDLDVFPAYYIKEKRVFTVGKPVKFSSLIENNTSKYDVADKMKDQVNALRTCYLKDLAS